MLQLGYVKQVVASMELVANMMEWSDFFGQTNKVLMHFGCPSKLGLKMKIFLEYMILEMGI